MKKNSEKARKNIFSPERLLRKNNKDILTHIDGISNEGERKKLLKELINYLEGSLLDRDAGNPGPKLIEQLKERLGNDGKGLKEYKLEDLIWWKGTEVQIEYLFSLLIRNDLIDKTQFDERFSLIAKHFKNEKGNRFKNKQLSQAVRNLGGKDVPGAEVISNIVNNLKNKT
ncbi:MAG TPA: hypothetical protein DHV28_11240 [Ignavibacteriales bacterium]|nr:hypothetical protein [Ignavibacteriales bacterium]